MYIPNTQSWKAEEASIMSKATFRRLEFIADGRSYLTLPVYWLKLLCIPTECWLTDKWEMRLCVLADTNHTVACHRLHFIFPCWPVYRAILKIKQPPLAETTENKNARGQFHGVVYLLKLRIQTIFKYSTFQSPNYYTT